MLYLSDSFYLTSLNWNGLYFLTIKKMRKDYIKNVFKNYRFYSFVGNKETAEFLTMLLEVEVKFNPEKPKFRIGDSVIVFQFEDKLPENKILTKQELKNYNYCFYDIEFLIADDW